MEENQTTPTPTDTTTTATPTTIDTPTPPMQSEAPSPEEATPAPSDEPTPPAPSVLEASAPAAPHSDGHKQWLVIAIAAIVLLALLGAVAYMYTQKNKTAVKPHTTQQANTTTTAPTASSSVDDAAKSIDDNIDTIDANKDFTSSDLSDATLGL